MRVPVEKAVFEQLPKGPFDDVPGEGGSVGDRESNELILERLHAARPDDAILSEESKDDGARLHHERVWIIDPLDGTREFGEAG